MREEELLIHRLKRYERSDMYPFHMPGHKRLKGGAEYETWFQNGMAFPNPFEVDITEIDGFDNLHHAEGILKKSMEWAAGLYGADRTWYLINGSTAGLLSAVCGCVPPGGRILMGRNCHKAAYHGVYLHQLQTSYVYPQSTGEWGIQGGILPEDVEKSLKEQPDIRAVLIVSPTYDGIVSDVKEIARVVHQAGLPLIVDEAHGAHFRYSEVFPQSALELGADVVIQSVHKTLPSLTQTAVLHMKCNRSDKGFYMDMEAVERYLQIFQSSSPSYVLMASIENSIFQMERLRVSGGLNYFTEALLQVRERLAAMKWLRLAGDELKGSCGIFDVDLSKIVVSTGYAPFDGEHLSEILRKQYHLEMEMCGADYVTAITASGDSKMGLERLEAALLAIDQEIEKSSFGVCENRKMPESEQKKKHSVSGMDETKETGPMGVYTIPARTVCTVREALDANKGRIPLEESAGRTAGEFVYIYPPGIPLIAPGECITDQVLTVVLDYIKKGLPVQGLSDTQRNTILCVEQ